MPLKDDVLVGNLATVPFSDYQWSATISSKTCAVRCYHVTHLYHSVRCLSIMLGEAITENLLTAF